MRIRRNVDRAPHLFSSDHSLEVNQLRRPAIDNNAGTVVVVFRDHVLASRSEVCPKAIHRIHVVAYIHRARTRVDQCGIEVTRGQIEGVDVGHRMHVTDEKIIPDGCDRLRVGTGEIDYQIGLRGVARAPAVIHLDPRLNRRPVPAPGDALRENNGVALRQIDDACQRPDALRNRDGDAGSPCRFAAAIEAD